MLLQLGMGWRAAQILESRLCRTEIRPDPVHFSAAASSSWIMPSNSGTIATKAETEVSATGIVAQMGPVRISARQPVPCRGQIVVSNCESLKQSDPFVQETPSGTHRANSCQEFPHQRIDTSISRYRKAPCLASTADVARKFLYGHRCRIEFQCCRS